ncbi:MAG TPA: YfaZ family outer membrane protein [Gammaproteobacteria bacterium]|nr:YfaZ family outer membrane protein [Gammaproteobacteria bacterium]
MTQKFLLASLFCLPAINAAHARGLDISIGNEAAQITYLSESYGQIGIGGNDIGVGFFYNENNDMVVNGGLLVTGNSLGANRAFQAGVGVKGYAGYLHDPEDRTDIYPAPKRVDEDSDSVSAIGIGGKLAYILPSRTPLSLSLEAYYAPDITAFGDNEGLLEAVARFEVEIAPTTRFFVGYRKLEVDFKNGDEYPLDETGHVGIRFSF